MKTRRFTMILFLTALAFASPMLNAADGTYSAKLITPAAGQVVYPGQKVRVQWMTHLPNINLGACEMEVWLSLDGGRTFQMIISPWMGPKAQYFDWTVPNTPTNAAVLDVRFGCEPGYPETYSPQTGSPFVIAQAVGQ
jgi:hypothetical protein